MAGPLGVRISKLAIDQINRLLHALINYFPPIPHYVIYSRTKTSDFYCPVLLSFY